MIGNPTITLVSLQEELSSQRDVGFESIMESVIDYRASNSVFDSESDVSQVVMHVHRLH